MDESADSELMIGRVVAQYKIESHIGVGGMASVYKVRHERLHTYHAMKVLKIHSVAVKKRLEREGRVQAQLRHPNILAVTDMVDVDGYPGVVMDFIDGPDLEELVERTPLSVAELDRIASGLLQGVAYAHAKGIVHRDLKPSNILLEVNGRELIPKVADFGLVKLLDDGGSTTRTGSTMGTPIYMSPEQVRDSKNVDLRSDVYSLGALIYYLAAGESPFQHADMFEVFNHVVNGWYTPLREVRDDLEERMYVAVERALQPEIELRPPSAYELLELWTGTAQAVSGTAAGLAARMKTPAITTTLAPSAAFALPDVPVTRTIALTSLERPTDSTSSIDINPQRRSMLPLLGLGFGSVVLLVMAWFSIGWFAAEPTLINNMQPVSPPITKPPVLRPFPRSSVEPVPTPPPTASHSPSASSLAPPKAAPPKAAPPKPAHPKPSPTAQPEPPTPEPAQPEPAIPEAAPSEPATPEPPPPEPEPDPSEPEPAPTAPGPVAPAAPPSSATSFTVTGAIVELRGPEGGFPPGPIPPGTYSIHARFPSELIERQVGVITLGEGDRVNLSCKGLLKVCEIRR